MDQIEKETKSTEDSKQLTIPGAIIAAGIIVALAIVATSGKSVGPESYTQGNTLTTADIIAQQEEQRVAQAENLVPVDPSEHILGNPKAKVFMIEYSDTECPFCKVFHETGKLLMEEYGKSGDLAWVYRQFPVESSHPRAVIEAHASECVAELAGNTAFWTFIDRIFEITPTNSGLDLALLPVLAEEVGIERDSFTACQDSERHGATIAASLDSGVSAGVTGTPYIFIVGPNGKKFPINGAQSFTTFRKTIDLALQEG